MCILAPCTASAIGASRHLSQFAGPHPVNPLGDHNLRMLGIANLAAEDTGAALPAHRLAGTPSRAYRGRPRSGYGRWKTWFALVDACSAMETQLSRGFRSWSSRYCSLSPW
jgi:hypothetical protein